jgi:glutamate synthase (NADPH/NADH) small chain
MRRISYILLLGILLSACQKNTKSEGTNLPVEVISPIKKTEIGRSREYTFLSRPYNETVLSFRINGPVLNFDLRPGQAFSKGSTILSIDNRDFLIRKQQTEALYSQTNQEYKRIEALYKKNNISGSNYEKAKADFLVAKSNYETAVNALSDTHLSAPYDGYIQNIHIEPFQDVKATEPILTFIELDRLKIETYIPEEVALHLYDKEKQKLQGARCMACGVPFCQSGMMIGGMASGCPLHNLVPETNDLVYTGNWKQAFLRLSKTHSFPEFTSRVCPALCEAACTCNLNGEPVSTKENERAIIETAYENGWVTPQIPEVRTGKSIAVIGSGPSGLAAAQQLNRRGHSVTVFERKDRVGGLLRYGIPNMKLDKAVVDRRIHLMEEEGVKFVTNVNVGKDIKAEELLKQFDRVILACGASNPRDIKVPGRDAKGIYFAVDFLGQVTKALLDSDFAKVPYELAKGKNVLVIGGGDTGNDCVGTSIRLGAKSVIQLEMMPKPPVERTPSNPWPQWPRVLKTDYGQEEAIAVFGHDPRVYQTTVTEFIKDKNGNVCQAKLTKLKSEKDPKTGRMMMVPVEGTEEVIPVDVVLIAAGFLGSEKYVTDAFKVAINGRTNVDTKPDQYQTSVDKVFTAGDMHRGQSLVVWAIREGREAAKAVDESLMGYSYL